MNPTAILALISDLYLQNAAQIEQIKQLTGRVQELEGETSPNGQPDTEPATAETAP